MACVRCNNWWCRFILTLAEKLAKGGLHCYSAPSTAALQWRYDDCASMTEPWWYHNGTCRLLASECTRRAKASLLSLCWASTWQRLHFAAQHVWNFAFVIDIHKCTKTFFRKSGSSCGTLLERNKSFSTYSLMTLPVRRPAIRLSLTSITDTLREEFANKGWWLYEIIYIRRLGSEGLPQASMHVHCFVVRDTMHCGLPCSLIVQMLLLRDIFCEALWIAKTP